MLSAGAAAYPRTSGSWGSESGESQVSETAQLEIPWVTKLKPALA